MGFKVFGKKDGKKTVSDNPENGDAKVTEAAKVLPEGDPATVNPNSYGGGRNLPMARKFRNSSNSAEFGALALLDFLPFVITKP